jgi:prolyl-tRNA synthetase
LRVRLDDRPEIRPGFKFNEWELQGIPLRVELGERELDAGQATLVRRDTGAKETASTDRVAGRAGELLADIQRRLLDEARAFRAEHTFENPKSYEVMREFLAAAGGLAIAPWCGSPACEDRVKKEARATIRCLPLERVSTNTECIVCGAPAVERATWSQAY